MTPEIWRAPRGKVHLVKPGSCLPMCGGGGWTIHDASPWSDSPAWIKIGDGFGRFFKHVNWWPDEVCKNCIRKVGGTEPGDGYWRKLILRVLDAQSGDTE